MPTSSGIFAAIDVSKSNLDLAFRNVRRTWRFTNNPKGIEALTDLLSKHLPSLIVLEATGGYEQAAPQRVSASQLSVATPSRRGPGIVNPRRVRSLARANGRLATPAPAAPAVHIDQCPSGGTGGGRCQADRSDRGIQPGALRSGCLSPALSGVRLHSRPASSDAQLRLVGMITRRRQPLRMITAEKNRLRNAHPGMHIHPQDHIAWLLQAPNELRAQIEALLHGADELTAKADLLCSAPSIGMVTAASLLADCPELSAPANAH